MSKYYFCDKRLRDPIKEILTSSSALTGLMISLACAVSQPGRSARLDRKQSIGLQGSTVVNHYGIDPKIEKLYDEHITVEKTKRTASSQNRST